MFKEESGYFNHNSQKFEISRQVMAANDRQRIQYFRSLYSRRSHDTFEKWELF